MSPGTESVVSQRGIVFSDDGGISWAWHDLPLSSGGAVRLAGQPEDGSTLVALARNGLYISRDAGNTWRQAASGLPSTPVQDFAAAQGIFTASMRTGGLYASFDLGQTWDRLPGTRPLEPKVSTRCSGLIPPPAGRRLPKEWRERSARKAQAPAIDEGSEGAVVPI